MNKLLMPFMTLVCLLFTACNKDDILPGGPMLWTYEILTPESVEYEGGTVGWIPKEYRDDLREFRCAQSYFGRFLHIRLWMGNAQGGSQSVEDSFSPSGFGSPGCIRGDYNLDK